MKPESKYKGSIRLSAIGDALGWMTEFEKNKDMLVRKFGTEKIEQFFSWEKPIGGRFYGFMDSIKAGSYSDDTQLLLAVARSIQNNGLLDQHYFAKMELPNWLYYARGAGRTVKIAANKISRKSVDWHSNFYSYKINQETVNYVNSGANGAAMRVLPIALANLGNPERIKTESFANSIITHGHPRAIIAAMLYGFAINQIIQYIPETFTWESFIMQLGKDFDAKFNLESVTKAPSIQSWCKKWNTHSIERFENVYIDTVKETQNYLRMIYQSLKQDATVQDTLKSLGCFDPATKGSGISTVIAGIYLVSKFASNPIDGILTAINSLGTDTDSIAAFTGGLTGALHGHTIIPKHWQNVQDINYLDKIATRLLDISEDVVKDEPKGDSITYDQFQNETRDKYNLGQRIHFFPLGMGIITELRRVPTITKGKYNLIMEVNLEIGQSIQISKLFSGDYMEEGSHSFDEDSLILLASQSLNPAPVKLLKKLLSNERIDKDQLRIVIEAIIKNDP